MAAPLFLKSIGTIGRGMQKGTLIYISICKIKKRKKNNPYVLKKSIKRYTI